MTPITKQLITHNNQEEISIQWDGTRFAITQVFHYPEESKTIILNPGEALKIVEFLSSCGERNE